MCLFCARFGKISAPLNSKHLGTLQISLVQMLNRKTTAEFDKARKCDKDLRIEEQKFLKNWQEKILWQK